MKKVIFNPLAIILMVAFTSLACSSQYPGFDKSDTGLYYKLYKLSKDTIKPQTGFWVSVDMRYSAKVKGKDTTSAVKEYDQKIKDLKKKREQKNDGKEQAIKCCYWSRRVCPADEHG